MKLALVAAVVVLGMSSGARAEPYDPAIQIRHQPSSGVWVDVGALWARVDPGNGIGYQGRLVRFAPHAMIGKVFYVGADIDIGTITSATIQSPTAPRTTTDPQMDTTIGGSLAAMKAVAGARVLAGSLSASAELAAGIRHASLDNAGGIEIVGVGDKGIVEAHARLDWWATPKLTLGALAGIDVFDSTNLVFGLEVGVHFVPYDHTRR